MGAGRPQPCEVCRRIHQGRCAPDLLRSVTFNVSLPGHLHRALVESVPWGERSSFVAEALEWALLEPRAASRVSIALAMKLGSLVVHAQKMAEMAEGVRGGHTEVPPLDFDAVDALAHDSEVVEWLAAMHREGPL